MLHVNMDTRTVSTTEQETGAAATAIAQLKTATTSMLTADIVQGSATKIITGRSIARRMKEGTSKATTQAFISDGNSHSLIR